MKKIIASVAFIFCFAIAHSQTTMLSFCTFVNNQTQECVFDNTKFITSPDSTHVKIFMMLRAPEPFGIAQATYKLYAIDRFGKEVFITDVVQTLDPTWMAAWQPAIFVSPGKYMVKVYKDPEHMLTSKGFEFFNN